MFVVFVKLVSVVNSGLMRISTCGGGRMARAGDAGDSVFCDVPWCAERHQASRVATEGVAVSKISCATATAT